MDKFNYCYDRVNPLEKSSWTPFLRQLLVCCGPFTVFFSMGVHFGAPTIIIHQMRDEANSTAAVSVDTASWLTSAPSYASLPWVFILVLLSHSFGRKKTFLFIAFINIISFVCFYLSDTTTHLMYNSINQGCSFAASLTTSLLILTELTSPQYRGIFVTMKSATFFWGIWVSNAIGTFYHWKKIPLFGLVCSLFSLTAFIWPESPYWLASRGRIEECKKAHRWLKGKGVNAEKELLKITECQFEAVTLGSFKDIRKKLFYKPTLICCVMVLLFFSTGKYACAIYSIQILKLITSNDRSAYTIMLILDGFTVFSSYIGSILSGVIKRRTQLFATSSIGILFLFGLSLYLYLIKLNVLVENYVLTIIISVIYSVAISCGPAIMAVSTLGELIPIKYKNLSTLFVAVWFHVLYSALLKVFPYIYTELGLHGAFLGYGVVMSIITAILFKLMPETKDKTLHEIEEYFK